MTITTTGGWSTTKKNDPTQIHFLQKHTHCFPWCGDDFDHQQVLGVRSRRKKSYIENNKLNAHRAINDPNTFRIRNGVYTFSKFACTKNELFRSIPLIYTAMKTDDKSLFKKKNITKQFPLFTLRIFKLSFSY